jgi:hypothetical protein
MKLHKIIASAALAIASFGITKAQVAPKQGVWRGTFSLFEGKESPFNFELKGKDAYLLNASERFELKGVTQKGDSLFIPVEIFDAVLAQNRKPNYLVGGIQKRHYSYSIQGIAR